MRWFAVLAAFLVLTGHAGTRVRGQADLPWSTGRSATRPRGFAELRFTTLSAGNGHVSEASKAFSPTLVSARSLAQRNAAIPRGREAAKLLWSTGHISARVPAQRNAASPRGREAAKPLWSTGRISARSLAQRSAAIPRGREAAKPLSSENPLSPANPLLSANPLPSIQLAQAAKTLRFAVVGDTGNGSGEVARGIAHIHATKALDAIVLVGDAFYPCGPSSASDPIWGRVAPLTRIGPPLLPVLGNHDFCGKSRPDVQVNAKLANWRFPARQYAVHAPLADFVMLDTTPFASGKSRAAEDALRSGFAGSRAPWRIAVGHHPLLSSGWHGHFPRDEHRRMLELLTLMRSERVDLYLCGHDHHLELIDGRPRMLVSGAGSDPVPPLLMHRNTLFPAEPESYRGFAVVELSERAMSIRFFDAAGRPKSGVFHFAR